MLYRTALRRALRASAILTATTLSVASCNATHQATQDLVGTDAAQSGQSPDAQEAGTAVKWTSNTGTQWTFYDNVAGTHCGFGQPTGFAVSPGTSGEIFFYLEGGGACWNEATCEPLPYFTPDGFAANFATGYTSSNFESDFEVETPIFNRTDPNNPYSAATFVFVPFCSGDFHMGTTTQNWYDLFGRLTRTVYFNGRNNLNAYLSLVQSAFPHPSRVTLTGTSAGGFGAELNYEHVRSYFPGTRVDLISDSGPLLKNPNFLGLGTIGLSGILNGFWNAEPSFPACAPGCIADLKSIYAYYDTTYTDSRFAFMEHDEDEIISTLVYDELPAPPFLIDLENFATTTLAPLQRTKFFIPGTNATYNALTHGVLSHSLTAEFVQPKACDTIFGICLPLFEGTATSLGTWLTEMHSDSSSWANHANFITQGQ
jgi:hypothetical protein